MGPSFLLLSQNNTLNGGPLSFTSCPPRSALAFRRPAAAKSKAKAKAKVAAVAPSAAKPKASGAKRGDSQPEVASPKKKSRKKD